MLSKSQLFAKAVFPNVQKIAAVQEKNKEGVDPKKYKSLCKKAGSLVRNSGLMQTLAFLQAKGQKGSERHHQTLFDHIQSELEELEIIKKGKGLYFYTQTEPLPRYMHLTREILRLLNWHKRLAETLILDEKDLKDNGSGE